MIIPVSSRLVHREMISAISLRIRYIAIRLNFFFFPLKFVYINSFDFKQIFLFNNKCISSLSCQKRRDRLELYESRLFSSYLFSDQHLSVRHQCDSSLWRDWQTTWIQGNLKMYFHCLSMCISWPWFYMIWLNVLVWIYCWNTLISKVRSSIWIFACSCMFS